MVKLKDIAARAGVSIMTVSKALREAKDISAGTRARIRKLSEEMGYVPDLSAQLMRSGKTRLFGLIISAATNPIYARIVMALEERAHEMGYDLLFAHSLNQPSREEACIRRLLTRRVDGLFITPVYRLAPVAPAYEEIKRLKVPTVILGHRGLFCSQFANVETDDIAASFAVTKHLIELGHRRIAYFTGPPVSPSAQERYEGYRRALREANIEMDDRLVFNAGGTIEEGEKAALQMLNENPKATAVQAVNDLVAIGVADVLLNQNVRIPEQISVAGFGNILVSEYFRVPLTTVRQPKLRLGYAAMDLMQALHRGEPPESKRLRAEVIARASTAPPVQS
ncbi:MAG TPA: LacI family DNA-binding transcriptional regulator [Candidatus Limnocylindria bacterium]|nr:LacI family DNA-binding transcriptional regulator [Candidatus Limnocylindria bacterium]